MKLDTLQALYTERLRDLYSAEQQILDAMPKMIDTATHADLKNAFADHAQQAQQHANRLEDILTELGVSAKGETCKGMKGIIDEAQSILKKKADADIRDAALIDAAQHVEHYEMAGYGSVCAYADLLGYARHSALLRTTLNEEKATDRLLTEIAELTVNLDAASGEREVERVAKFEGAERPADDLRRERPRTPRSTTRPDSEF